MLNLNRFEGAYYKHQKGDRVISIITGSAGEDRFIQVITNDQAYRLKDNKQCAFSKDGICLDIETKELTLKGSIKYGRLSPIKYDIMGPFKYFPMECRHGIVSMDHELSGALSLNGNKFDFTGGRGYMETDSGRSFPKSYTWVQCNDFKDGGSFMLSVADIPFMGLNFTGIICVITDGAREYRLATYKGARIKLWSKNRIVIVQGGYKLIVYIEPCAGFKLNAPRCGVMSRTVVETVCCPLRLQLIKNGRVIMKKDSKNASFEHEDGHI